MSIKNTSTSYGSVSIIIHWVMALTIFFMFGLGLYMVELTYYDSWYKGSFDLHKSLGIVLFFLLLFRVTWRYMNINPVALSHKRWEVIAGYIAHFSLYVIILLLMFSGYFISTADGRGIVVFKLFSVPALPVSIENQEDLSGDVHAALAWGLILLVLMHVGVSLKHHFTGKDKTLIRMLKS